MVATSFCSMGKRLVVQALYSAQGDVVDMYRYVVLHVQTSICPNPYTAS